MLIYNHKKEFLGINDIDLNRLGFSNLESLTIEVHDFADLFVKKPGFVHNFKHVNWIDFIACADSLDNTKVIIRANSRNFQCHLSLETVYLTAEPSSEAFIVNLNNLKELGDDEADHIAVDLLTSSSPKPIIKPSLKTTPQFIQPVQATKTLEVLTPLIDDTFDNIENVDVTPKTIERESIDLDFDEHYQEISENDLKIDLEESFESTIEEVTPSTEIREEIYENGYMFDPLVASSELGLPVELIEEFIEDFVAQANDFKKELYSAHDNNDNDQVKILSHKLKGVAANLRIEDALETLTTINTSTKNLEIQEQLDIFYKIISKLSGEKIEVNSEPSNDNQAVEFKDETPPEIQTDSLELDFKDETPPEIHTDSLELDFKEETSPEIHTDSLELDFKEETSPEIHTDSLELDFKEETPLEIQDNEVPDKINMPELADDDFLLSIDEETQDIETQEEIQIAFTDDEVEDIQLEVKEEIFIEEETPKIQYNKNSVANEIGLDQDSFNELFLDYLQETENLTKSITTAISTQNIATWKHQTLKLKGMSDNMRMSDFTKEIEILLETQDFTQAQNANEAIIEKLTQISKIED